MPLERILDLTPANWFYRNWEAGEQRRDGLHVETCLPGFECYVRVLHPIRVVETNERILWKDLAAQQGLEFHPEFNERLLLGTLTSLAGPDEGVLDEATLSELVGILAPITSPQQCWFYYSGISIFPYEPRLYRGRLEDICQVLDSEGVRALPERWWPDDRSWSLLLDADLRSTFVGGPPWLIHTLLASLLLECVEVAAGHRVDDLADTPNFGIRLRQVAARILSGATGLAPGALEIGRLSAIGLVAGDPVLSVFTAISSESTGCPLGPERQHWAPELLAVRDKQLREIESSYRAAALAACKEILAKY